MFVERGLEVPATDIARRARLGTATLYRHFPTRADLVAAVFTDRIESCVSCILQASLDPDPWRGFAAAVEGLCTIDADCRGLTSAFLSTVPGGASGFDRQRRRAEEAFADLVRRAKGCGQLRADFSPEDLSLLLMANAGLVRGDVAARRAASHRLAGHLLIAFRADPHPATSRQDGRR